MNRHDEHEVDALIRAQPVPGNPQARLERLLARLEPRNRAEREISKGNTSDRAYRRSRASVKLSMASAVLAASLLLAAGVGLGRVGVQKEPLAQTQFLAPANGIDGWADTLGKSSRLAADRLERMAKANRSTELAPLAAVYGSAAAQLVRETAAEKPSPERTAALLALAEQFQRDSSRFARLAAESEPECRDLLNRLAADAGSHGLKARELAG